MTHRPLLLLGAAVATLTVALAQTPPKAVPPAAVDSHTELARLGQEYAKAFNAGDAKKAASFWSESSEYTGPDGVTVRGRAEIEKDFAEQFKTHPGATLELKPGTYRTIGGRAVVVEGTCVLTLPSAKEPVATEYSALIVHEDEGWRVASIREWFAGTEKKDTVKDLDWLVGEWSSTGDGKVLRTKYEWDDAKTFLHETYSLTKDGKVLASGLQIIGSGPDGVRSWLFDKSGATGNSVWTRDGNRWVIEGAGLLPDGSETSAVHLLVPLGADRFTWQSTQRTTAGVELTDSPPLKVTRVKAGK